MGRRPKSPTHAWELSWEQWRHAAWAIFVFAVFAGPLTIEIYNFSSQRQNEERVITQNDSKQGATTCASSAVKEHSRIILQKEFLVAHFLTVKDQAKSREFYVSVLGGKIVKEENPCYIKLENSWIILNSGGGPTPDKPDVWLAPPHDLNRVSSFLNLHVADIRACYRDWSKKGAQFLTKPLDNHGHELRCYMRDPDGYLIEVGQPSQLAIDAFRNFLG